MNSDKTGLEFYIGMIFKWYWVVFIPFIVAIAIGIYLVIFSQRFYESRTVILVQPQKLPEDVVKNVVAEDINTRVTTLAQRIQSRTNLEQIIHEFHLFEGEAFAHMYTEDMVTSLRDRIAVKTTRGGNRNFESFIVSYTGTDPDRVAKITKTLATHIIDENMKLRETQVLGTNSFLEDELESMRKRLVATETRLKEYREQYMGGLPEQLNSNLRILETFHERLTHVKDEIRSSKYRLDSVLRSMNPSPEKGAVGGAGDTSESLESLRKALNERLMRYTKYHPDILRLQSDIRQIESHKSPHTTKIVSKRGVDTSYKRQRRDILSEISLSEAERDKLLSQIAVYKKRVEDTPKREQELLSLKRDYENIRSAYHSLLGRQLEAQIAVNMEKKQKGEQFRIIDPARVPQKPASPDMKKLVVFVLAAGLGVGCGIVALLEFFMQTFRGGQAVALYTSIPVIAVIPSIEGPKSLKGYFLDRMVPILLGGGAISSLGIFLGLAFIRG